MGIAQQRTIIQQYGDWYTGRWWVGCYIWYSQEGHGRAEAPPSPLLAVPNVTAHPSTASVGLPTSCYSMWHYNCLSSLKGCITIGRVSQGSRDKRLNDDVLLPAPSGDVLFMRGSARPSMWWVCPSVRPSLVVRFTSSKDQNVPQWPLYCSITALTLKGQRSRSWTWKCWNLFFCHNFAANAPINISRIYRRPPQYRRTDGLVGTGLMPYKAHSPKYQHFMLFPVPVYSKYEIWNSLLNYM